MGAEGVLDRHNGQGSAPRPSFGERLASGQTEDARLLQRVRAGDASAMDDLVHRHYPRVFNLALRLTGNYDDAQDIVSEAFVRAYRHIHDFRGNSNFGTWLHSIVKNVFLSERKKQRVRKHHTLDTRVELEDSTVYREMPDPSPGPESRAEQRAYSDAIHDAVRTLPEPQRLMIALYHFQHLSYDEIAEIMSLPVGTVKSRLNRARLALRVKLRHTSGLL